VAPWPGAPDPDFHATLAAVWIWARHQRLSGVEKFAAARTAAWAFLVATEERFIPDAIDSAADDEAAYDCAMVLWAVAAERGLGKVEARRQAIADRAARVLAAHLGTLEDLSGREFRDPGFLALALIEYARELDDRGLLASGRKFVERAFGMKAPARFAEEPAPPGGLFDFSSTTDTRILAVIAAEGNTPFVGAWLRERIAAGVPAGFLPRRLDENSWNACVAWALGRAYAIATDPVFLHDHPRRDRAARHRPRRRAGARSDGAGGRGDADLLLRAGGRRAGHVRRRPSGARRGGGDAWMVRGPAWASARSSWPSWPSCGPTWRRAGAPGCSACRRARPPEGLPHRPRWRRQSPQPHHQGPT
jgi:hypothetical protein